MISRREALIGIAGSAAAFSGCARIAHELAPAGAEIPSSIGPSDLAFVNRLTFGCTAFELDRLAAFGREAYVDELLAANRPEDARLQMLLHRLDVLRVEGMELRDMPQLALIRQFQSAAVLRAVYGANPLLERMADFWINHFNIDANKGTGALLLAHDTNGFIRKHALGRFPDLLRASSKSSAMLSYLDAPQNQSGRPNENYARELLELHSLGVNGGYTQRDVMEVARCFTGWTVEDRFLKRRGSRLFKPELHDDGPKEVLGNSLPPGGGEADAERVVEIAASHPSTAHHIATKLCREFLGTDDSPWAKRLESKYVETGGDLKQMLRPLLLSDDLVQSKPVVKRPLDFVASALRATGAETDGGNALLEHLDRLGQPLHQWPMPDGFPVDAGSWSGTVLGRWNFALALTAGSVGGTGIPESEELPPLIKAAATARIKKASQGKAAMDAVVLYLASPEFQWR